MKDKKLPTFAEIIFSVLLAAAIMAIVFALSGCATLGDQVGPPEVRTVTVQVPTPIAVPCFSDADRPVMPKPITVNVDTATTEQLAAAELADALAMDDYVRQVDALFVICSSKGTNP